MCNVPVWAAVNCCWTYENTETWESNPTASVYSVWDTYITYIQLITTITHDLFLWFGESGRIFQEITAQLHDWREKADSCRFLLVELGASGQIVHPEQLHHSEPSSWPADSYTYLITWRQKQTLTHSLCYKYIWVLILQLPAHRDVFQVSDDVTEEQITPVVPSDPIQNLYTNNTQTV